MKLMFASDIHGSALYCEKMLEAYSREGAERLCLLGDILYHGPRNDLPEGHAPKKVIAMLNPMKPQLMCVRGNCDTEVDHSRCLPTTRLSWRAGAASTSPTGTTIIRRICRL